ALGIAVVSADTGRGESNRCRLAPEPLDSAGRQRSANAVLDQWVASGEFNRLADPEVVAKLAAFGVEVGEVESDVRAALMADIQLRRSQAVKGTQIEGIDLTTGIGR